MADRGAGGVGCADSGLVADPFSFSLERLNSPNFAILNRIAELYASSELVENTLCHLIGLHDNIRIPGPCSRKGHFE